MTDALADLFRAQRERLFAIAYRMLGSVAEAEDVVQEAFVRYGRADRAHVASPEAFLTTTVTRLAIDALRSARARRERYVGSWLPEPLVTSPAEDAAEIAETADTVSLAFLVLLESLAPVERAVFLLREAFDFPYEEIAPIVGRSVEACRQIAVRARHRVEQGRPRFEASAAKRDELARRFFASLEDGSIEDLVALLAADAVLEGDGGGNVPALARPLHGAERIARTLAAWARQGARIGARVEPVRVNGQPGARFLTAEGRLINVMALDVADGRVRAVRSIINPEKLAHLGPLADLTR